MIDHDDFRQREAERAAKEKQDRHDRKEREMAEWLAAPCPGCERTGRSDRAWVELRRTLESDVLRLVSDGPPLCPECYRRDVDDRWGDLARMIHIPPRYAVASFDECPDVPKQLVSDLRDWAVDPYGFAVLTGPPGCGKTYLAACILRHVLREGLMSTTQLDFDSEGDYLHELKRCMDSQRKPPDLTTIPLLVFDDLGASRLTDWARDELTRVIDKRYANGLATVCTTNLSIADLGQSLDGRASSRLAADGNVFELTTGKDLRQVGTVKPPRESLVGTTQQRPRLERRTPGEVAAGLRTRTA